MTNPNQNAGSPSNNKGGQGKSRLTQIMAVFFLLGGVQVATQYFAYRFQYQPQLGVHFNQLYPPWSIFEWANKWYAQYPEIIEQSGSMGVLFAGAGLIVTLIVKMVTDNSSRPNTSLHGSARWANEKDIQAARLLPIKQSFFKRLTAKKMPQNDYVYVGAWQDKKGVTHYLKQIF